MPEKILLACYDFPPNTGIGGRRWAKFAKGLASLGHEVFVIKADPAEASHHSDWTEDGTHPRIQVRSLPRRYPRVISHGTEGILDKLRYFYHLRQLRRKEKGTIYDIAIGWEEDFLREARSLIQQKGIRKVIATGAPFNLLYYAAKLKQEMPELTLLCDYRDPWLNATNYGMADLPPERKKHEESKQAFIMEWADLITAPNSFLLDEIKGTCTQPPKARFEELPHFFDPDDLKAFLDAPKNGQKGLKLVYGGTLYVGLEPYLQGFAQNLQALKLSDETLLDGLHIDVYTPHLNFAPHFAAAETFIQLHPVIGKGIFQKIHEADAVLIFLAAHNKHYLTTKFFEYLPFRKPLLFVGAEGHAAAFIEAQQLGLVVNEREQLRDALRQLREGSAPRPGEKELEAFSLISRTQDLLNLLA